jgi:hypothetical protein
LPLLPWAHVRLFRSVSTTLISSPTFLDIYLTRLTGGKHTEPEFFKDIFERGIDPDVDDPTKIHAHSEVPVDISDWPLLQEVLAFRDRVRLRLRGIYDDLESGKMEFTQRTARVLFMTYEHEAQHAETLLYMLAQSLDTEVPGPTPEWETLARVWEGEKVENKVLEVKGRKIVLGHDDVEQKDDETKGEDWSSHEFGWDEESPSYPVEVKVFKVDALPITNQEYLDYLNSSSSSSAPSPSSDVTGGEKKVLPASWIKVEGTDIPMIRSFYGPLPFHIAKDWPLMASKLQIEAFAAYKGGRLPSEAELRALWESDDGPRVDGEDSNIGFRNWHPIPYVPLLHPFFAVPPSYCRVHAQGSTDSQTYYHQIRPFWKKDVWP